MKQLNKIIKSIRDAKIFFKNIVNPNKPNKELIKAVEKYKQYKIKMN